MIDRCMYDLRAHDTKANLPSSFSQDETAHAMARVLLRQLATDTNTGATEYVGPSQDRLWLPQHAGDLAKVQLMLVDLDVESIAAVAEIADALGAELVPRDGGAVVPAQAEAVLADVARRALLRVQSRGTSLYAAALELETEEKQEDAEAAEAAEDALDASA